MTQASITMAVSNNPATIHNLLLAMPGTLKMDTLAGTTTVGFSDGLVSTAACCDCDGVSAGVSLETEPAGCCLAASSALPVSIAVFVPLAAGARVSVSP